VKVVEPGMIKTGFAGRFFEFNNEPAMTEYQSVVHGTGSGLAPHYLRETRLFGSSGNDRLAGGLVFDGICQVIQ